jgi:hypothetical protein
VGCCGNKRYLATAACCSGGVRLGSLLLQHVVEVGEAGFIGTAACCSSGVRLGSLVLQHVVAVR